MEFRSRQTDTCALHAAGAVLCLTALHFFLVRGRGAEAAFDDKGISVGRYFPRRQAAASCLAYVFKWAAADVGRLARQHACAYRGVEEFNG